MTDRAIAFDIGGTNTRVAILVDGVLGEAVIFPTASDPKEGIVNMLARAQTLLNGKDVCVACGCVAGSLVNGIIVGANNLILWNGFPVVDEISRALGGIPTTVFNDAELVGIGEFTHGAGRGAHSMLYVTVSTGVGKARITDGVIMTEQDPFKMAEEAADLLDLEYSVSGTAVQDEYGVHPRNLNEETLNSLALQLGKGIATSVANFCPDVVVFGGAMIVEENPIPLAVVERELVAALAGRIPAFPAVKAAELKSLGGLWGATAYLAGGKV